jgi:hypothetical protein
MSWSGTNNNSSTSINNTVTMPAANRTVTVNYEIIPPDCFRLTLAHTGSGANPTANPPNSSGCSNGRYQAGSVIALTAAPAVGWRVDGWNGTDNNSSTSVSNVVTMPAADWTVTVDYVEVPAECFRLTRTHSGSGADPTATPANSSGCATGEYRAGTAVTLTAAPAANWRIEGWLGSDNDASTSITNIVTMPDADRTVSVIYGEVGSPAVRHQYLPVILFECFFPTDEGEPNDGRVDAYGPLCLGSNLAGRANDKDDYFFFELKSDTAVTIDLPARAANVQQLQLIDDSNKLLAFKGGEPYAITCRLQPGRYFIRLIAVEPFSANSRYNLTINTAAEGRRC